MERPRCALSPLQNTTQPSLSWSEADLLLSLGPEGRERGGGARWK